MKRRYVYVATWGEFVKIGMSEDPPRRIAGLTWPFPTERPPGRPELAGYVEGGAATERLLHVALSAHSIGHEWFRRRREVADVVEQVCLPMFGNCHGPVPKQQHVWRRPRPLVIYPEVEKLAPWTPPEPMDF